MSLGLIGGQTKRFSWTWMDGWLGVNGRGGWTSFGLGQVFGIWDWKEGRRGKGHVLLLHTLHLLCGGHAPLFNIQPPSHIIPHCTLVFFCCFLPSSSITSSFYPFRRCKYSSILVLPSQPVSFNFSITYFPFPYMWASYRLVCVLNLTALPSVK